MRKSKKLASTEKLKLDDEWEELAEEVAPTTPNFASGSGYASEEQVSKSTNVLSFLVCLCSVICAAPHFVLHL
jgi:hypothetical protein